MFSISLFSGTILSIAFHNYKKDPSLLNLDLFSKIVIEVKLPASLSGFKSDGEKSLPDSSPICRSGSILAMF